LAISLLEDAADGTAIGGPTAPSGKSESVASLKELAHRWLIGAIAADREAA
jgi:hypothetical protein